MLVDRPVGALFVWFTGLLGVLSTADGSIGRQAGSIMAIRVRQTRCLHTPAVYHKNIPSRGIPIQLFAGKIAR
jgi:hypothetical protein